MINELSNNSQLVLLSYHFVTRDTSKIAYYHHHHHVVLVARISLTLSRHFSLSFIAWGRSSRQHPVSSHSCWMYVHAGRPAFAQPCVGVHKSTSLMSSSLLLQQCPACLVCLTWIVFVIGGRWLYSWCLVGCCRQDLFKIARSILVIHPNTEQVHYCLTSAMIAFSMTYDLYSIIVVTFAYTFFNQVSCSSSKSKRIYWINLI